jgi:predicted acetyltransferase
MLKIGPESDAVLWDLFQHYLRDMAEWFEVEANSDGSYSYDTSVIWEKGYDASLAKLGDSVAAFALVGSADEYLSEVGARDVHEFFVLRKFRRDGWRSICGASFAANGL